MQSDNLRRNPYLKSYTDGTANSLEYSLLQKNVLVRAMAYQNYANRVCNIHTDYNSSEISQAKDECINRTLDQLAPIVSNVEKYYDYVHNAKHNVVGFVDYLKNLDKQAEVNITEKENREIRFGKGSFYEKYRTFMH